MAMKKGSAKRRAPAGPDAIALMKKDHQKVRKLLGQLEKAEGESKRSTLFTQIDRELKVHTQIEEEIFYPAYRDAAKKKDDRKLFFEAAEEHGVVDMYLPKRAANDMGSEEFGAQAKVLKDLVEHHAEEEETEMFPKARKLLGAGELKDLGKRMSQRKVQLQRGGTA